ncbi:hypothetical protein ACFYW8_42455 [Streptomyces sp. NPDC002742]
MYGRIPGGNVDLLQQNTHLLLLGLGKQRLKDALHELPDIRPQGLVEF